MTILIGLEYFLSLYNMQHIDLANKLGIKKQNINLWIKGKQKISKKYLPILEEIFGIKQEYFIKDLNEIEKLEIQNEKLKKDINPVIKKYEQQFMIDEINDIVELPAYDKKAIKKIEKTIEKVKLISRFKEAMDIIEDNPYMDNYRLMIELMEKVPYEDIVYKTVEALGHYFEILPDSASKDPEQDKFESEIFKIFDDNNF